MAEPHTQHDDLDVEVDFFGQLPGFNIYTQISFCFPMALSAQREQVIQALEQGLEKLSDAFPWCAGKVVAEQAAPGRPSIIKIKRHLPAPSLVVKDLTSDPSALTMESLRDANFPFRMLDESLIAPRNTIPGTSSEPISKEFPVFIVQANFIIGGLILTINAAHNVMDMVGQGQLIRLFSKACRGEPFTPADLKSGVLDVKVPTLDDLSGARMMVEHQIKKRVDKAQLHAAGADSTGKAETTALPPPPPAKAAAIWAYFDFPPASLEAIKSRALGSLPATARFVSTDDALSAFIWQAIARARLPRFSLTTPSVTFGRAVDVRSALGISPAYMAIMQNMVYTTFPTFQDLVAAPLGAVAAQLRGALDPEEMKRNTYALATCVRHARDNVDSGLEVDVGAHINMDKDLMLSSWAKVQCYDLDFGLGLGEAECVRRPQFVPVESLMYLMPRTREGDITFAACLSEEDMRRLVEDDEFSRFSKYIP
ncbi:hypothetical protein D9619_004429 [Psilocybe cf. subviscida]|uniref:Trichothecene 3-O-acetyltransferase-like N-terminal domain-containing protein n=1 Tax=Psilocybe cf. subviscida TaxID=2480587 RepID=A0A8H5BQR2_9AGAR|nr:hypothetical protein D9619_004429 [Psilocybe cf. subviscida]